MRAFFPERKNNDEADDDDVDKGDDSVGSPVMAATTVDELCSSANVTPTIISSGVMRSGGRVRRGADVAALDPVPTDDDDKEAACETAPTLRARRRDGGHDAVVSTAPPVPAAAAVAAAAAAATADPDCGPTQRAQKKKTWRMRMRMKSGRQARCDWLDPRDDREVGGQAIETGEAATAGASFWDPNVPATPPPTESPRPHVLDDDPEDDQSGGFDAFGGWPLVLGRCRRMEVGDGGGRSAAGTPPEGTVRVDVPGAEATRFPIAGGLWASAAPTAGDTGPPSGPRASFEGGLHSPGFFPSGPHFSSCPALAQLNSVPEAVHPGACCNGCGGGNCIAVLTNVLRIGGCNRRNRIQRFAVNKNCSIPTKVPLSERRRYSNNDRVSDTGLWAQSERSSGTKRKFFQWRFVERWWMVFFNGVAKMLDDDDPAEKEDADLLIVVAEDNDDVDVEAAADMGELSWRGEWKGEAPGETADRRGERGSGDIEGRDGVEGDGGCGDEEEEENDDGGADSHEGEENDGDEGKGDDGEPMGCGWGADAVGGADDDRSGDGCIGLAGSLLLHVRRSLA
ncbi:hypothetical protein DFJ73DRAFT_756944 [Zopfochytrium polystomum]|nr:hypothetical protein DFJ73DRAFT_756944 [Zopfochytrium polystomum]